MEARSLKSGEIYLASFPYGDQPATKLRPVLLLTGPVGIGTEIVVAYISSVIPPALLASDLMLDPTYPAHSSTNLKLRSVLRLHKLATIHERSLQRLLGSVSTEVWDDVLARLRDVFKL